MQNIFLVVGSCRDTIILNGHPEIPEHLNSIPLECWSPEGSLYLGVIKTVAGNIVEVNGTIRNGQFVESVPLGSFVVVGDTTPQWFVQRYYAGVYNDMITKLMKKFGITDYKLSLKKGSCF